jgi:O-antigen/teichoic acid export membrane protein
MGAVGGLIIASLIAIVYTASQAKDFHLKLQKDTSQIKGVIKGELPYAALILVSLGFVTFLYSGDVLVVKHFFSPEIAGAYGGIATIARSIFFVTASISAVLISSVNVSNTYTENKKIFLKGLTLVTLIGGLTTLVFVIFPSFVTTLLIGSKYVVMSPLLPLLSVLLFLISVLNLFVSYFLALRSNIILAVSAFSSLVLILLIAFNHQSVYNVVIDFILATLLSLALLFYKIFR